MHVALQIVAKAMFGAEIGDEADDLAQATLTVLDHIMARARTFGLTPTFLPTAANRRYWRAMKALDDAVNQTIAERRAARAFRGFALHADAGARRRDRPPDDRPEPARRSDDHAHRRARNRSQRPGVDVVSAGRHAG